MSNVFFAPYMNGWHMPRTVFCAFSQAAARSAAAHCTVTGSGKREQNGRPNTIQLQPCTSSCARPSVSPPRSSTLFLGARPGPHAGDPSVRRRLQRACASALVRSSWHPAWSVSTPGFGPPHTAPATGAPHHTSGYTRADRLQDNKGQGHGRGIPLACRRTHGREWLRRIRRRLFNPTAPTPRQSAAAGPKHGGPPRRQPARRAAAAVGRARGRALLRRVPAGRPRLGWPDLLIW